MAEEFLEDEPQLDLRKYREVLRRRRWYFVLPFFVGWAAVLGASWFMPSVYRSGTLILVEQPTVSKDLIPSTASSDLQDRLDSIQQQVLSRTRLLGIIDHLNLYPKQRAQGHEDELVERMRKDVQIELVRAPGKNELTAFNIYFSADNPYTAQQVTTELTNILISENLEAGIENSANVNKFLDSQLDEARKGLAAQEEKVRQFKEQHPGDLPGNLAGNLQILGGKQAQLQSEEDALGRAKQQSVYLQSLAVQYRAQGETLRPGQTGPVGLPAINQTLDRLKAQLADLSSRYTDQYPDVRKVREQIANAEKTKQQMIADLKNKPADAPSDASANDYTGRESGPLMEVQSQLKANQIEIANRQHAIVELQAEINDYQGRLNRAPTREQELTELTRDYDQSRANYDSLLAKRNQQELATNLNKTQEGEHFRMLDPPSLPTKPFSPDRFKMSLGGLFVGMVLGALGVVGGEFLDDRMYEEEDFKKLFSVDVMAEIPALPTPLEESQGHSRIVLESVAAGILGLIFLAGIAFSYLRG